MRQPPGTPACGVSFVALKDESRTVNVVTYPPLEPAGPPCMQPWPTGRVHEPTGP